MPVPNSRRLPIHGCILILSLTTGVLVAQPAEINSVAVARGQRSTKQARSVLQPPTQPNTGEYRVGAGDVLQISVWKEPDASVAGVVVRPDGYVSLPLVGSVSINNMTTGEIERLVSERLLTSIRTPEVSVVVKEANSRKVYLIGAVRKECSIKLQSDMTVLQVLSEAGGLSEYAKRKKMYILRTENQTQTRIPFNYEAVLRGDKGADNILVRPGDIVVVPQ